MSDGNDKRTFHVDMLARVEGEGRFVLEHDGDEVTRAELNIFEAPRYFEALLRGRDASEVPDIVARICGICPVAYQMSAVAAIESLFGCDVGPDLSRLRRLLYCGEWIESHALHIHLLHAPDFLGYPSAVEMAAKYKPVVERGLRIKKAGNALVALLGGRAIHPVSPRLGGFTRVPTRREVDALLPDLRDALDEAIGCYEWAYGLAMGAPRLEMDYVFVAIDSEQYPLEHADALLYGHHTDEAPTRVPLDAFDEHFRETHEPQSTALHCKLADGRPYLCGAIARLHHHAPKLHPRARALQLDSGLPDTLLNPNHSIAARTLEVVHALAEAVDILEAYSRPSAPFVRVTPRAGSGFGATEAPRGMLFHRYDVGEDGKIVEARIVPPTSQNQARIEADLVAIAPTLLALPHDEATHRCEMLIRAHDPCISCATHFLDLRMERAP